MIRFLLYFAALLILLNAAILMWPDKINYAPHVYAAKDDLNPHFVRLNKEIEERFYTDDLGVELIVGNSSEEKGVDSEWGVQSCYRIGPFMHQANYELAQAVLFNADVDYKKSKRASKASNVFRIYLGPYQGQPDVDRMRIELRQKKILDHFVRKQDDGTLMISLGIYSTEETAGAALRLFREKLSEVRT